MEKLYLSPVGVFSFSPFEFTGSELLLISSLIFVFVGFVCILLLRLLACARGIEQAQLVPCASDVVRSVL
jgi:hypothetical protein